VIDLDALQRLHEAATPEPWTAEYACIVAGPVGARTMSIYDEGGHSPEDAAMIAASRNALPALLRLARRARRLEEAAQAYLRIEAQCWMIGDRDVSDALDALRAALAEGEGE